MSYLECIPLKQKSKNSNKLKLSNKKLNQKIRINFNLARILGFQNHKILFYFFLSYINKKSSKQKVNIKYFDYIYNNMSYFINYNVIY